MAVRVPRRGRGTRLLFAAVLACAAVLPSSPARTQGVDADRDGCADRADPARSIPACSRIIDRGATVAAAQRRDALVIRANALRRSGRPEVAIADYDAAILLDPRDARIRFARGRALVDDGRGDEAITAFGDTLQLASRAAEAHVARGRLYLERRDGPRAFADFDAAIGLGMRSAETFHGRAEAAMLNGALDRAFDDLDRALRLDPRSVRLLVDRARARAGRGEHDKAIADYDRAIELAPATLEAYVGRAASFRARAADGAARSDLRTALEISPDDAAVLGALAALDAGVATSPLPASRPAASSPAKPAPVVAGRVEKRVALVIGNARYRAVPALVNPPRDSAAVSRALRDVGFETVEAVADADRTAMIAALRRFETVAATADWAVVYYAGHGIELGGVNYLVPVDATLASDNDVGDEAVPLDRVLAALQRARGLKLVLLDACRDNPFLNGIRRSDLQRSIGRGLGRVEPVDADRSTVVFYAARHGTTARDGEAGRNSPFVAAMLRHIATPGVEIRKFFGLVVDDVFGATGGAQTPFIYGTLGGADHYFRPP